MRLGQWACVHSKRAGKKSGIMVAPCTRPWWPAKDVILGITQSCQWTLEDNDLKVSEKIPGGYSHEYNQALVVASSCWQLGAKSKKVALNIQLRIGFMGDRKGSSGVSWQECLSTLPGLQHCCLLGRTLSCQAGEHIRGPKTKEWERARASGVAH